MKSLATYSIEADNLVLLTFEDGLEVRVGPDDLPKMLISADLRRVKAAFRARRKFIVHTLPPWARSLGIAVIVLGFAAGSVKAFSLAQQAMHAVTAGRGPGVVATSAAASAGVASAASATMSKAAGAAAVLSAATTPAPVTPATALPSSAAASTAASGPIPAAPISLPLGVQVPNPVAAASALANQVVVQPVKAELGKFGL
jgi:hypothetical protein